MTTGTRSTVTLCRELGINVTHLYSLMRGRHVAEPRRDAAGRFQWSERDARRVRRALEAARKRREVSA
jgi:hypothetical protein